MRILFFLMVLSSIALAETWLPPISELTGAEATRVKALKLDDLGSPVFRTREKVYKDVLEVLETGIPSAKFPSVTELLGLVDKLSANSDAEVRDRATRILKKIGGRPEYVDWKEVVCAIERKLTTHPHTLEVKALMDKLAPGLQHFMPPINYDGLYEHAKARLPGVKVERMEGNQDFRLERKVGTGKIVFDFESGEHRGRRSATLVARSFPGIEIDMLSALPPGLRFRVHDLPGKPMKSFGVNFFAGLTENLDGSFAPYYYLESMIDLEKPLVDLGFGPEEIKRYQAQTKNQVCEIEHPTPGFTRTGEKGFARRHRSSSPDRHL